MSWILTFADLALAIMLFWHSASSPSRDAVLRAMLYAFAFAVMCFGVARFLSLTAAGLESWRWMVDLGHVALIVFGAMWVGRETGRMAKLKGN
jgi:hypothetical protein